VEAEDSKLALPMFVNNGLAPNVVLALRPERHTQAPTASFRNTSDQENHFAL
jgi:hypothetical protein